MFGSSLYRAALSLGAASVLLSNIIGVSAQDCGSTGGGKRCPLNTCCSGSGYCGTTTDYCGGTCQSGFGSCTVPTIPSCATSGKSATNGRHVAYWQVQQVHDRTCDAVAPSQIQTAGLSHLILSFAHFDTSSFAIIPANSADVPYYAQFTALQSSSVKTWIAIGGGGFSRAAWTSMASTSANRAKFISSLKAFMTQYGFTGADLDWEFPNSDGSDSANFVALVRELRASLGTSLGISAPIPADWGSVEGINIAGMSQYVDFLNYMSYDFHGWQYDPPTVRYPADIRDVDTDLRPLWANATSPGKVNLGIPLYGRGYTLSNTACTSINTCSASGPSTAGQCVRDTNGIMSLGDIRRAETANNAKITLDSAAMQKVATWGNQWMAYDDADTAALKSTWADSRCLGGIMYWSLDQDGGHKE